MSLAQSTRSANMKANRRRDSQPELAVRRLLHARGLRYRCDLRLMVAGLAARPDIVFTRAKVAVFIDGCFWHCCPEHGRYPAVNGTYWRPKLARNVARDAIQTEALTSAGWIVIRAWEHELPADVADRVTLAVSRTALKSN